MTYFEVGGIHGSGKTSAISTVRKALKHQDLRSGGLVLCKDHVGMGAVTTRRPARVFARLEGPAGAFASKFVKQRWWAKQRRLTRKLGPVVDALIVPLGGPVPPDTPLGARLVREREQARFTVVHAAALAHNLHPDYGTVHFGTYGVIHRLVRCAMLANDLELPEPAFEAIAELLVDAGLSITPIHLVSTPAESAERMRNRERGNASYMAEFDDDPVDLLTRQVATYERILPSFGDEADRIVRIDTVGRTQESVAIDVLDALGLSD